MAAAAFVETMILKGNNGRVIHIALSADDVANNYVTAPDGNTFIQLPSDQNYAIIDLIVVTGGTDTKFQEIYANSLDTGIKISNAANLNTSNYRQFQQAPITFKAGSLLRLKELSS